ncbi:MAG TPA: hypothetical protein VG454_11975, partial [Gemmatimonadales bacterium]|nr:hypothetical protein [Gemmatimonadales bacterium]
MKARSTFGALILAILSARVAAAQAPSPPVSVADLIGMTLFGSDPHTGGLELDAHVLSPDGSRLAAVLQRGNLGTNTLDFALVVFPVSDAPGPVRPDTLVTMSTPKNDPAISSVQWLADSRTIAFLGAPAGQLPQIYTVDVTTRKVT